MLNYVQRLKKDGIYTLTLNDAVSNRIIRLLKEKNMTQYRLELKAGLTHGAMNGILSGHNKTVTFTTIYRLARGFDMTIYEFLDDDVFRSENLEID